MTALVRILPFVRVGGITKISACNRNWICTTNLPQILTWKSIWICPVMMLDAKKHRYSRWQTAVFISIQSCCLTSKTYSRLNFVPIIIYKLKYTLNHIRLMAAIITHPDRRRRVFELALPYFWSSKMAVSPGSSLINHSYCYILVRFRLYAAILNLCGRDLLCYDIQDTTRMCLGSPTSR